VFDGTVLNGHENNDDRVPQSCLWTVGSLLAAARFALENPALPACSPTSGFHHAHRDYGGGFCTFNGLMVVSAILVQENPDIKIAILDCDAHYGDGTAAILQRDKDLAGHVMHRTQGNAFQQGDKGFQKWLEHRVKEINNYNPDVVLYQAGADPHINDPLGGLLTSAELALRDKTVFEGINAGIAWNLAGGYQPPPDARLANDPVLKIHMATLHAANDSIKVRAAKQLEAV
jgi:acetoin utilization deacetylase AcuC-like enzyme